MERMEIMKIAGEASSRAEEHLSEEVPLTIEVNGIEAATLLCSPDHLDDLATGFLFTSGLIAGLDELKSLVIDPVRFSASATIGRDLDEFVFKRVYTSGCGKGVIFHNPMDVMGRTPLEDGFSMEARDISALMKEFVRGSEEHASTRGVHSAALADTKHILIFRDDIGRHNALDKVIGQALSRGLDFSRTILLTTGRISSEILSKVLRCRIPLIAALGSPTNQAVKLARVANLAVAGHVRGVKMDVYSGESRLIAGQGQ